jgi:CubicO group peptidase (beta-lactamase class C family)
VPGLGTLAVPFWAPNGTGLAAAGAISSNVRDMGQWVRFLLARGVFEGNRLVSEKAIDLAFSALIPSANSEYGLGWHIQYEDGYKKVWHGGTVAGFHSFVFLVPEQRLGFAMLANTRSSRLPHVISSELWSSFIPAKPKPKPKSKGGEKAKSERQ